MEDGNLMIESRVETFYTEGGMEKSPLAIPHRRCDVKTDSVQARWRPRTRLGRWAVGLTLTFAAMFLISTTVFAPYYDSDTPFRQAFLPFYWAFMLLCGLTAGVIGLVAMTRQHERSWLVWLALLAGIFSLLIVLLVLFGSS
jgi:peptidoglycan/LPS O-acetylase OafA/YrhL